MQGHALASPLLVTVALLLLATTACDHSTAAPVQSPSAIRAAYQRRLNAATTHATASAWWLSCEGGRTHNCGMLTESLRDGGADTFVRDGCGEDPARVISDDCRARFRAAFFHELPRRYPRAFAADVDDACREDADLCRSLPSIETQWILSHNRRVYAAFAARAETLAAEHKSAQREAARAQAAIDEEDEDARRALSVVGVVLRGFGTALAAGAQTQRETTQSANTCSSDMACGAGNYCVKPQGSYVGECAHVVNEYGTRTYAPPRFDSSSPGNNDDGCSFDTQCPVGFRCIKGSFPRGNCMK